MSKESFTKNLLAAATVMAVCLGRPAVAQEASGPIVRCLEGSTYLVQCNAAQLQPNDLVMVKRAGHEVARGKVLRREGQFCSLLVEKGEVRRMDVVYSLTTRVQGWPAATSQTYGAQLSASPERPASIPATTKTKRDEFFSGLEGGRVLDLGGGSLSTTSSSSPYR
jgi:hypothetical protein